MELFLKCSVIALFSALVCMLIRKHTPELSLLINLLVSVLIITACVGITEGLKELISITLDMFNLSNTFARPMLKCMGIGLISKLSADFCREASLPTAACALEYAGVLCAASVAMPVISSMLKLMGTII